MVPECFLKFHISDIFNVLSPVKNEKHQKTRFFSIKLPENIISSIKKHPRAPAGARGCFLIDEMMFSGDFIDKNLVY